MEYGKCVPVLALALAACTAPDDAGNGTTLNASQPERGSATVAPLPTATPLPGPSASPTAAATLPLARGVYVITGTPCADAPNAAIKLWNGEGLSGSTTRDCRATIESRDGDTYRVRNSCENTYDRSRTDTIETVTVHGPDSFTLNDLRFARCAPGEAPAAIEAALD